MASPLGHRGSMLVGIKIPFPLTLPNLASLLLISPQSFPSLVSQVLITMGHFRFLKHNEFFYLSCIFMLFVLPHFLKKSTWHTPNDSSRSISQVTFFLGLYITPSLSIFLSIINSFLSVFPRDHVHGSIIALIMEFMNVCVCCLQEFKISESKDQFYSSLHILFLALNKILYSCVLNWMCQTLSFFFPLKCEAETATSVL